MNGKRHRFPWRISLSANRVHFGCTSANIGNGIS
jgi:hypothetical protein